MQMSRVVAGEFLGTTGTALRQIGVPGGERRRGRKEAQEKEKKREEQRREQMPEIDTGTI